MKLPRISLITPSYNQGRFIRQTIDSVLKQNYPGLEYWVQDGGSSDETLEVLRSYGSRVQWVSRCDRGQTDAINQGIKQTKGDIVGYLNADDLLLPNALWRVAMAFTQNPTAQWLTGDYRIINENQRLIEQPLVVYKQWQRQLGKTWPRWWPVILGFNNPLAQPSTFWRRLVHQRLGYLDESYHYVMDYDWWWRLLKLGSPLVLTEALSAFRVHAQSKGGQYFRRQFAEQEQCAAKHGVPDMIRRAQAWHNQLICAVYARR